MANPPAKAGAKRPDAAALLEAVTVEELATVVAAMNRFLMKFAAMQAFTDAKLSIADWIVMMILQKQNGFRYGNISLISGIAGQRVVSIVTSLVNAGLVTTAESDDPKRPNPILSLTESGRNRLSTLDATLLPLLKNTLESAPASLVNIKKSLPALARIAPE